MCGDDKAPTRAKTDRWRVKQTAKCKVINANYKIHKLILSAEGSSRCLLINIALLSTPPTSPPSPTLCIASVSWFYYSNNKLLTSVIMTSESERSTLDSFATFCNNYHCHTTVHQVQHSFQGPCSYNCRLNLHIFHCFSHHPQVAAAVGATSS